MRRHFDDEGFEFARLEQPAAMALRDERVFDWLEDILNPSKG